MPDKALFNSVVWAGFEVSPVLCVNGECEVVRDGTENMWTVYGAHPDGRKLALHDASTLRACLVWLITSLYD